MGPFLSKEIMHLSVWCVLEFLLPFASSLFLYWRFFSFSVFLCLGLCCFSTFTLYLRLFLSYVFDFWLCCFNIFALYTFVSSVLGYVVLAPLLYSFKKQQQPVFLRIWVMLFQHLCFIHFCWSSVFFLFYACFALSCSVSLVRLFPWSSPSVLYCLEPGNHTASVRNLVTAKSEERL